PHAAHDHPGAGEDGGAVGQVDGAQRFAGERPGARRAAQRHADQFAAELVDSDGVGKRLGYRQHGGSQESTSDDEAQEHDGPGLKDHSIEGSTRSGGRWPSMKVRMLIMTFSPMSIRPSMVAEPRWGRSTTLPARASRNSFGFTAGSCSNTSRPVPASSPASIMRVSAFSSITSPRAVLTT